MQRKLVASHTRILECSHNETTSETFTAEKRSSLCCKLTTRSLTEEQTPDTSATTMPINYNEIFLGAIVGALVGLVVGFVVGYCVGSRKLANQSDLPMSDLAPENMPLKN
jgi:cation transporter-like permease